MAARQSSTPQHKYIGDLLVMIEKWLDICSELIFKLVSFLICFSCNKALSQSEPSFPNEQPGFDHQLGEKSAQDEAHTSMYDFVLILMKDKMALIL